jgi:cytochrome c2
MDETRLHAMAYNGKSIEDPEIREMFTRESVLKSKWYHARLLKKQSIDVVLWTRNIKYLEEFLNRPGYNVEAERLKISERLDEARKQLAYVQTEGYLDKLVGTLGADPIHDGYAATAEESH